MDIEIYAVNWVSFWKFQHLNSLLENYLEPTKREQFFANSEINALFGNIQDIVQFQQQFLQSLEDAIQMESGFMQLEHPNYFKVNIMMYHRYLQFTSYLIYNLSNLR